MDYDGWPTWWNTLENIKYRLYSRWVEKWEIIESTKDVLPRSSDEFNSW